MISKYTKFLYHSKKIGKLAINEVMESFLYVLYISTPPIMPKLMNSCYPDFSQPAIAMRISRFYKKGYITKIKSGKNYFIALTEKFLKENKNFQDVKREKFQKGWDKKWRMLIYDIPEKHRNKRNHLRIFIKNFGFGKTQQSSWVSPYDFTAEIFEFSKAENILDYICIYEGKFYAGKKIDDLVDSIWNLKDIDRKYEDFTERCREGIDYFMTKKQTVQQYYKIYHTLYSEYQELLRSDPFLPQEFLRYDKREQAEKIFNELARLFAKTLEKVTIVM